MTWFGQGPYIPEWFRNKPKPIVDKYKLQRMALQQFVGRPVIVISRYLVNPIIGCGLSVVSDAEGVPVLAIQNYVTNEKVMACENIYGYDHDFLRQYYDTDPSFIVDLLYDKSVFYTLYEQDEIDKAMSKLYDFKTIVEVLKRNGFYESDCMCS